MDGLYVQIGCGHEAPDGWLNFDASPTAFFERLPLIGHLKRREFPPGIRYGNIIRGLPLGESGARAIYCSHVLEHLSRHDLDVALQNTWRHLKIGGIFRLVMPDLETLANQYLADGDAESFMTKSGLGNEHRPRTLMGILRFTFGNSRHLWLWDERSIRNRLENAGFTGIRRCTFGDADDPMFQAVELEHRFTNCLAMEARK